MAEIQSALLPKVLERNLARAGLVRAFLDQCPTCQVPLHDSGRPNFGFTESFGRKSTSHRNSVSAKFRPKLSAESLPEKRAFSGQFRNFLC